MSKIWKVLTRKKVLDPIAVEDSRLSRILGTFDLTALGVGSTLGVGVYILAGKVAKDTAGPSVVLSFFIAAVVSVFAGLCYAEFGARVPRAGSAYIYSYVCIGEFTAFVIGWNLILEYVIGSASVARGISLYLDTLLNNTLEITFKDVAPIHISFMSEYFDFIAFGLSVLLAIAMSFGLKESSLVNNIVTTLNIGIVLFVVVAGSFKADVKNWHIQPDNFTNTTLTGNGGFFPFGLDGTIKGAATCFYGFVGFDCIATTGEEVKNPKRAIPISIITSLGIIFLAYFGISTVLTLMVPYYLQNENAPIPYAFDEVGWYWAKWVVAVGGICGLFSSLFGAMFPLPRIIYAMASDSLIFRFLGTVNSRFHTPIIGTLLAGLLTGLMGALFELAQLVNMMSLGTLMAYTVVAASVLLLRYSLDSTPLYTPVQVNSDTDDSEIYTDNNFTEPNEDESNSAEYNKRSSSLITQIFNCGRQTHPTKTSQNIVTFNITLYCITCVAIGLCAIYMKDPIIEGQTWALVLVSCVIFLAAILIISVATQPSSQRELSFKVPVVPLIPALSILANIYLMLMLDYMTWIRFAIWMAIGIPIYYFSLTPIYEQKPQEIDEQFEDNLNGKIHYYQNVAFVDDTLGSTKKGKAPLPPLINGDKTEVNEIQQELKKFDEMLDKVANDLYATRNLSVNSVSVSMSCEENVLADVHCNNVITPAIPSRPTSPVERPNTLPLQNNLNDYVESLELQKEAPSSEEQENPKKSISVDSPAPPDTPVSYKSATEESESDINNSSPPISPKLSPPAPPVEKMEETSDKTSITPLPPSPLDTDIGEEEERDETSVTPRPPPLPVFKKEPGVIIKKPLVMKTTASSVVKPPSPVPRVTSSEIKSITLKSSAKRNKKAKSEYIPKGDENLKVGSDEANSFKEQLSNKLSSINSASYIPILKYRAPLSPQSLTPPSFEIQKNENVIEDSINRENAREKLCLFINSRVNNVSPAKNVSNASSNSSNDVPSVSPSPSDVSESVQIKPVVETVDDDYLAHQNRMKNVFRSLKIMDTSKEPTDSSRIARSLEHKIDDHTKHRQAMSDIFNTIQLRRKESVQQQSKI